jgi:hypothetical protein
VWLITLTAANIAALAVGVLIGTAVTLLYQPRNTERQKISPIMLTVCAAASALSLSMYWLQFYGVSQSWLELASSLVFGLLSAAGPMTLVLCPIPAIRCASDAADYLRRTALAVAVNFTYGVGFATVAFAIVWGVLHVPTHVG